MYWTYDLSAAAGYVYLRSGTSKRQQILAGGSAVVDLSEDGSVVGIELLAIPIALDVAELSTLALTDEETDLVIALAGANISGLSDPTPKAAPADYFERDIDVELELV